MKTTQTKFMKVVDHGTDKIDLQHLPSAIEFAPIEFHFKADGSVKDEPSLTIVMLMPLSIDYYAYGQMSLETLNECLNAVGYRIEKNNLE